MTKFLVLAIALVSPGLSYADSHKGKDNSSKPVSEETWKREDCLKISEAAGLLLYQSGELLKASENQRNLGKKREAARSFELGLGLSEVSANFARNFEAFCK